MEGNFYQANLLRKLCWRADRVELLLDLGENPRRWDDGSIRTYHVFRKNYLVAYDKGREESRANRRPLYQTSPIRDLYARRPHIWDAHQLHAGQHGELRAIIQARILARENDEQIARKCRQTASAIDWYERLFFNVRDRLNGGDWVYLAALRLPCLKGNAVHSAADVRHLAYKKCAYYGGSLALDYLLKSLRGGPITAAAGAKDPARATIKRMVLAQAWVESCRPLGEGEVNPFPLVNRFFDGMADAEEAETLNPKEEASVAAFLEGIPVELRTPNAD